MTHRVLGHWDLIPIHPIEVHGTCGGISTGAPLNMALCNVGGALLGTYKKNDTIKIGLLGVNPMGLGHDAGPFRTHALVCVDLPKSIPESILDTLKSSVKPQFSVHKFVIGVSGSELPVCVEAVPCLGNLSAAFCGAPSLPNITPIVPTHLSLYSGMTWGDVAGGTVNLIVEFFWSYVEDATWSEFVGGIGRLLSRGALRGVNMGLRAASNPAVIGALRRLGINIGSVVGSELVQGLPGLLNRIGTGSGTFSVGPSNLGVLVQQGADEDGVEHDADPGFSAVLIGVEHDQDSDSTRMTGLASLFWSS